MPFLFIYETCLWLLALFSLPKMFYQRFAYGKYRNSLAKRFGFGFPLIAKGDRTLIWIHAVSLGETKAILSLAKMMQAELCNPLFVISSITETGHAEAQRSLPFADYHVYLPFDFIWLIRHIVKRTAPDLVILSETDLWHNFLASCKANGARIALVNGKLSIRSMLRLKKFPYFSMRLFSYIDLLCVQNNAYYTRFEQIGIPSEKMHITGNLKFDDEHVRLSASELCAWKALLGVNESNEVLVLGSTHDPEEVMLLDTLQTVWDNFSNLKVLLVPRHPERFNDVAAILRKKDIPFFRLSEADLKKGNERVVLIDAMGILKKCYQIADIALVAGSYTDRVGGHNIVEPCPYGVPVLFGPHMHAQPELVTLVKEYGAGLQVPIQDLASTLHSLLENPAARAKIGKEGVRVMEDCNGSTFKTWQMVCLLINA